MRGQRFGDADVGDKRVGLSGVTFRSRSGVIVLSAQALFVLVCFGVATARVAVRRPADLGLAVFCLAVTLATAWLLIRILRMQLVIDGDGFAARNLFGRTKRISWDQVKAIGWADMGAILLSDYPMWRPTVAFRVAGERSLVGADATCLLTRGERERLVASLQEHAGGRRPLILLQPDDLRGYWIRPGDRNEPLLPD